MTTGWRNEQAPKKKFKKWTDHNSVLSLPVGVVGGAVDGQNRLGVFRLPRRQEIRSAGKLKKFSFKSRLQKWRRCVRFNDVLLRFRRQSAIDSNQSQCY